MEAGKRSDDGRGLLILKHRGEQAASLRRKKSEGDGNEGLK